MVLNQTLIFLFLMAIGMYDRKKGMLDENAESKISAIVVNIAYPAIILSGVTGKGPHIGTAALVEALEAVVALLLLTIASASLIPRFLGYEKKDRGIVNLMTVFTNIGFMGVPMIQGIYGQDALIYMTIFLIPFNLLFYSYAMKVIRGSDGEPFHLKDLLNAGMIACVLAVAIYFSGISLPYVLSTAINMVGSMTAPLAMMLVGASFLDVEWKEVFCNIRTIAFTVVKMVILPVAITMAIGLFVKNIYILSVCMAALSTPSGNVLALLASLYNKEAYPTALSGIAMTTIVSVITMPVAFRLAGLD